MTLELKLQDWEQEGYDRGKNEGVIEGASDERIRIIMYMLSKGSSIEEISNTIGISVSDIERLIASSPEKK